MVWAVSVGAGAGQAMGVVSFLEIDHGRKDVQEVF